MLEVERAGDLAAHIGRQIGPGEWFVVGQDIIDRFAQATGDDQWIHVDTARAEREVPGGRTIAHGYLTLSLLPLLARSVYRVRRRSRSINYGLNKVRFTRPVPSGARIRLSQTVLAVEAVPGGTRLVMGAAVEIEGEARPALIAETITLIYDEVAGGAA